MYIYGSKVRVHVRIWYWLGIFLWGSLYAPQAGRCTEPEGLRRRRGKKWRRCIVQLAESANKWMLSRSVETNDERWMYTEARRRLVKHVLITYNPKKRGWGMDNESLSRQTTLRSFTCRVADWVYNCCWNHTITKLLRQNYVFTWLHENFCWKYIIIQQILKLLRYQINKKISYHCFYGVFKDLFYINIIYSN